MFLVQVASAIIICIVCIRIFSLIEGISMAEAVIVAFSGKGDYVMRLLLLETQAREGSDDLILLRSLSL